MSVSKDDFNKKLLPLFDNEEIVEKLAQSKSPEECYELAKPYIPEDVSFAEFQEIMGNMYDYAKGNESGLLDMERLDEVAGGDAFWDGVGWGVGITASAAAVGVAT